MLSAVPQKISEIFWTQFDARGKLCLRLISSAAPPPAFLNGQPLAFKKRCDPDADFPVYVWEAPINKGGRLKVGDKETTLPTSFKKFFFLGDTGCRPYQLPAMWPFKKILQQALSEKPDLIIHLGDYIYRHLKAQLHFIESPLYFNEGDNWLGWYKEFFEPATQLLAIIPWVFVRGNQENQNCAPKGWFRFFDGHPYTSSCLLYSPVYSIPLDKVTLIVHDSSYLTPENLPHWPKNQLSMVMPSPSSESWLLTHRPIWGLVRPCSHPSTIIMNKHSNLQAFLEPFPSHLSTIFSGHIHAFQSIKLATSSIQSFVIGNSGVALEEGYQIEELRNTYICGRKIEYAVSWVDFGYAVAEYLSSQWHLIVKDKDATPFLHFIPSS